MSDSRSGRALTHQQSENTERATHNSAPRRTGQLFAHEFSHLNEALTLPLSLSALRFYKPGRRFGGALLATPSTKLLKETSYREGVVLVWKLSFGLLLQNHGHGGVAEHREALAAPIDGDGDVDDGRLSEGTGLSVPSREL